MASYLSGTRQVSLIPLPVKAFTWRCTVRHSPPRWRIVHYAALISLPAIYGVIFSPIVRHFVINTASVPSFNWGSVSPGWRIVSSTVWHVAPPWRILWLALLAIFYRRRRCFPGVLPRRSWCEVQRKMTQLTLPRRVGWLRR